ncbi:discoidin domain-containing protein [Streptomyces sp. NPDC058417]|uniref:discoidin domain-containing protein n=1 Tax=unclassified Streptomyces TaxID=2593676 RepID=UPI00364D1B10
MSHLPPPLGRRRFLHAAGLAGALAALPAVTGTADAVGAPAVPAAEGPQGTPPDAVAAAYHRVLLAHTRWSETQWDAAKGYYTEKDFGFAVVLGHAVLLTRGRYDADRAGIDAATLRSRTLATIRHFAASNRLTGGTEWGRRLFFDTTFQSYFVLAARLLWKDLDATTRAQVTAIARDQATYTAGLRDGDDAASGTWTPHGLTGGHVGDTKLEEMGVYAQALAPGLAWSPDDPKAGEWAEWFGVWSRNEAGLPPADLANPAVVDGVAVSANRARNLYDTFVVENHGSFGPHYQAELWRTSGRNAAHFLAAGRPLPQVLARQPNAGPLWRTLLGVMSDAGEPLMPMVADREHLYGRDVIPLAFLSQVMGDRAAARAETELASRLEAYQQYPPEHRMAKFSGEPKYEPEARAEIAISYLLHAWAVAAGKHVRPLSADELFARASGVTDHGTGPGLVSHQTRAAWAGAVSKAGLVKFAWQPGHDDWLFRISGATPMFLPSTGATVRERTARVYTSVRDGFDGSATVLRLDAGTAGFAGFATLPTGAVVYASTGLGDAEGHLEVHNLTMPGMPGLDGERTYRFAEGRASVRATDRQEDAPAGRVDDLVLARTSVRHVRMLGVRPHPVYGYSLFSFEVRDGSGGSDLARGGTATASSADAGRGAALAVDGDGGTRWAVSRGDRGRADSWLAVDLGAERSVDRVTLRWESAAGRAYRVQGSADGRTWRDLATGPRPAVRTAGGWLDVEGRAGLVVRGGTHPIGVYDDVIVLGDGASAPLLVEGFPTATPDRLRAAARAKVPAADRPEVRTTLTDGHLTLFNLSGGQVRARVAVPRGGGDATVFEGAQTFTADGTSYEAVLDAATAVVLPPRFTLSPVSPRRVPSGLRAEVVDGATIRLSGASCVLRVRAQGRTRTAVVRAGRTLTVVLDGAEAFPYDDLALGRTVFPTGPLPDGMSDPADAVDGDRGTAWRPGRRGRMVVDLGAERPVSGVEVEWASASVPGTRVGVSADGLAYTDTGAPSGRGRVRGLALSGTARYVSVEVDGSAAAGAARLRRLTVR